MVPYAKMLIFDAPNASNAFVVAELSLVANWGIAALDQKAFST
jgi:hypothetical protein